MSDKLRAVSQSAYKRGKQAMLVYLTGIAVAIMGAALLVAGPSPAAWVLTLAGVMLMLVAMAIGPINVIR
ncbi:MAG: hypothetical protein JRN62_03775 [Nitrososphaerota archaeon]|jgi:hypothetical protein|nr:hypothetical protein [Nitrososphaerota archaeon]MDG6948721.1 hypothetical protein [Nitrososphaerota archaeon]